MQKYKLREVFTPGGMPSVTYVDRKNLGLEKQLRGALARGHSIITVSGPTKSGKTVLCRTVISKESSAWIEGGRIKNPNDFWNFLADELQIATDTSATKSTNRNINNSLASDVNIGIPGILGAKGGGTTTSATGSRADLTKKYTSDIASRCIKSALERKLTIVIDDFHFLEKETQKTIVNSLKGAYPSGEGRLAG